MSVPTPHPNSISTMDPRESTNNLVPLPLELWGKIFGCLLDDLVEEEYIQSMSTNDAPLLLCSVCRSWREFVEGTPDLWTVFNIEFNNDTRAKGGLEGLRRWMSRSGNRPLTVTLHIHWTVSDADLINPFLEILFNQFYRFARFDVSLRTNALSDLARVPRGEFPLLRSVRIDFCYEELVQWFSPFFENNFPGLRRLTMREFIASTRSLMPVDRHLHNLTYLSAVANNFSCRPVDILAQAPNLVECRLYFRLGYTSNSNRRDTSCTPFVSPHLAKLWLRIKSSYQWRDIFEHATFPALKELTIIGDIWPVPSFVPFLQRSKCQLRELVLPCTNISSQDLVSVLRCAGRNMTVLILGCQALGTIPDGSLPCFDDYFIEALDPRAVANPIVPMLRTFHVECQGTLSSTDGRFIDVVRARQRGAHPFRHIHLQCSKEEIKQGRFHHKDFAGLVQLRDDRLSVYLYPSPPQHS